MLRHRRGLPPRHPDLHRRPGGAAPLAVAPPCCPHAACLQQGAGRAGPGFAPLRPLGMMDCHAAPRCARAKGLLRSAVDGAMMHLSCCATLRCAAPRSCGHALRCGHAVATLRSRCAGLRLHHRGLQLRHDAHERRLRHHVPQRAPLLRHGPRPDPGCDDAAPALGHGRAAGAGRYKGQAACCQPLRGMADCEGLRLADRATTCYSLESGCRCCLSWC
jgi:hypothetical protein